MLTECEVNGTSDPSPPPSPVVGKPTENGQPETPSLEEVLFAARQEFQVEANRLKKEFQMKVKEANREKEAMVMRYANSEKEILKVRKEMDNSSKQVQNLMREIETLNKKNKMLSSERERLINMIDAKVCEVQTLQKDCDRLKEENSSKDFKIKWTQNKLSAETEAYKETQCKLDKCTEELKEALEEAHRMRKDCQDMINSYTPDPETCSNTDDSNAEVDQNEETGTTEDTILLNPFQKEIDILKQKHKALIDENNSLSCRVQSLQQERLDMEHKMFRLQESNADHLHQIASLQSDLASADSLRIQFLSEQERVVALQHECDQLRQCNTDLLSDMGLCRGKEAELLSYTQQVTEKNVLLQSEFSAVEAKSLVLEDENKRLLSKINELQQQIKLSEKSVLQEKKYSGQERQNLLNQLENEKEKNAQCQRILEEANGDILLMKKRHETSLRELTKELKVAMRCAKEGNGSGDGISQSSRTSSSTSLNNIESSSQNPKSNDNQEYEHPPIIPDQQALVERIVKLQRMLAKKQEKNEFLEEHGRELRETAKRQRKIIQTYAMCQDAGAMSSDISDQNKAELIRHGGVMASVYTSKAAGDGVTLDLSLEINGKLHALLEDTLLKNITLKDNLSTLGEENSKLTDTIRQLRKYTEKKPA